jgi:hypothetical protein
LEPDQGSLKQPGAAQLACPPAELGCHGVCKGGLRFASPGTPRATPTLAGDTRSLDRPWSGGIVRFGLTRLLLVSATAALLCWVTLSGASTSVPSERAMFARQVAHSDAVVVGTVVSTTELAPEWWPDSESTRHENRVSSLLIEEVLFGPFEAGDTLLAVWTDLEESGVSPAEQTLELTDWTGTPALWLVGSCGPMWVVSEPAALSEPSDLELLLSRLRYPPFYASKYWGLQPESAERKLGVTEEWLDKQVKARASE